MASSTLELERTEANEPINWHPVRSVYRKLHTHFHVLTKPFGIRISRFLNRDLAHLVAAIDVVDRELDKLDDAVDRQLFARSLLQYLRGDSTRLAIESATNELVTRMRVLRNVVVRREIQVSFCDTVEKILEHTEAKRQALDERQMIAHLTTEWRLTGHLTVLLLGDQSTPEFEDFFYLACESMPAFDTIQDARSDYRTGQSRIRPHVGLYVRLLVVFMSRLPKLLYLFPARGRLFKYAISFFFEGENKIA